MVPTSARRRIEKKTSSQSSAKAPVILWVQSDLTLVHCPSINGNNLEGETNKQTNNMCTSNKGKQTDKQTSRGGTCRGTDAGGGAELHSMWSPIHNASEYAEELQRCIGDASEKCGVRYAGSYSDIIPLLRGSSSLLATHMVWGGGGGVTKVEILHNIRGIGQVIGWEPLIVRVQPSLELP